MWVVHCSLFNRIQCSQFIFPLFGLQTSVSWSQPSGQQYHSHYFSFRFWSLHFSLVAKLLKHALIEGFISKIGDDISSEVMYNVSIIFKNLRRKVAYDLHNGFCISETDNLVIVFDENVKSVSLKDSFLWMYVVLFWTSPFST